jgi:hypothetical protein
LRKEGELKRKADNLLKEVKEEFYKTAIEDMFKDALEEAVLWFADNKPHKKPKCNKCDNNRNWVLYWPNGEKNSRSCDCARFDYWYEPQETYISKLKYKVHNDNSPHLRYYKLEKSYQNTKATLFDDFSYNDFHIVFAFDKFDDDVIEVHEKQLRYNQYIGFKTKEACQEYCDWLNDNKED